MKIQVYFGIYSYKFGSWLFFFFFPLGLPRKGRGDGERMLVVFHLSQVTAPAGKTALSLA